MQITQTKTSDLNALITVKVEKSDYEQDVENALKSYRSKIDMKGFRKGHVPKSLIKKMYGNQILADTLNDLLSKKVNTYIADEKISILGHPIPKEGQQIDVEIKQLKDFDFEYEIGLEPDFSLSYLEKKPKMVRQIPELTEKMIDEEVDRIRKRFGTTEEVDKVEDDEMLTVRFDELDETGNVKEEGVSNQTAIALDMIVDKKIAKTVKTLKLDEHVDIQDIFNTFKQEKEAIIRHLLGIDTTNTDLNNVSTYRMTLEKIQRIVPAEINQEFLDRMYGKGNVKNEEEMRQKIKEDVSTYFNQQADKKLYNQIADTLIEKTDISLPDEFLKRWIQLTNEKPVSKEQIEHEYPGFQKNLKWTLIMKRLGKENNIQVELDEIKAKTREQLLAQMRSYGIDSLGEEEMQGFVDSMLQKEDHVNQTKETILEEKLFDYFVSKVQIKDKKVSLEDFNK